jgi:hypothetical protein
MQTNLDQNSNKTQTVYHNFVTKLDGQISVQHSCASLFLLIITKSYKLIYFSERHCSLVAHGSQHWHKVQLCDIGVYSGQVVDNIATPV